MQKLVLKVDVETLRGTRVGVPNLIALFQKKGVCATFLFSVGPDNTGKAIKQIFRPGFASKMRRSNYARQYGVPSVFYGTLMPAPDIGRQASDSMRAARDAGFECGLHSWDRVRWQDHVMQASLDWTESQMAFATSRFKEIFESAPKVHGAAGWQMSPHALRCTQQFGFSVCSDSRGTFPHFPLVKGEPVRVAQFPTTLPTLDEILSLPKMSARHVPAHLLSQTESHRHDHIFTLHAEREGVAHLDTLETLIDGWQQQGYELCALETLVAATDVRTLPYCEAQWADVPGRRGHVLTQGKVVVPPNLFPEKLR